MEIPAHGKLVFGRDDRADITVTDHLCSRRHFEVIVSGEAFTLKDLNSSNGTHVNDQRVAEPTPLRHGDCILAGETQATFLLDANQGARGLVGKTVGGYRILERIGRGGMGTVYKANQTSLNRTVALKILSPKIAEDPAFVARFHKEAQAAGRLNHPNIVQVYDVGSEGGLHFYSMEYIENGSVQDLATRDGALDPDLALAICIDAARGLEYAEKRGLVHRDIKPDNLMVNAEGVVKIADLGLARDAGHTARDSDHHAGEHHDDDEGIFGTPHFIAPEQALGKNVDTRSDIYALGATAYRLVTGGTPFRGDTVREIIRKQIDEAPTPVREKNKEVPAALATVIERMMRKDPDERPSSARELVAELERVEAGLEGSGNRRILIAAGVLVVAAVAAFAALSGGGGGDKGEPDGQPDPQPPITTPGPGPKPDNGDAALYVEALKALNNLRLDRVRLGGSRDEEALKDLAARYAEFTERYEGGPAWRDEITEARDTLAELQQRVTEATARRIKAETELREATAAAERAVAEVTQAVDLAIKEQRWSAAYNLVFTALRAPELRDFSDQRSAIDKHVGRITEALRASVLADQDRAKGLLEAQDYAAAITLLEERLTNLGGEVASDPRLDPMRDLADGLRQDLTGATTALEAQNVADRGHDQREGFAARQAAYSLLSRSFDPNGARALLQEGSTKLRTASWKQLLASDLWMIDQLTSLRRGFIQRMSDAPADKDTVRLISSTGNREVSWKLLKVGDESFTVQRGPYKRELKFSEFPPEDLNQRLFALRKGGEDDDLLGRAVIHLISGDAGAARECLSGVTDLSADLRDRMGREIEAAAAAARIRRLEAKAERDNMAYLQLMPLTDRFLEDFRDTIAFALNSDGSTAVFDR